MNSLTKAQNSANMLKEERQQFILEEIKRKQKVLTIGLSQDLSVSEDTIRRDLKELADKGQVKKVHGGAVSHSLNPFSYQDRKVYAHAEKIQLAAKAATMVQDRMVVLMDGGTTNLALARSFPAPLAATIITNSLPIAVELAEHPSIEIIFLGGKLLKNAQVTVGQEVIEALKGIRADICFLGTRSIHHQLGITEIDWDETKVKRAMMEASGDLVSLVIREKIGTVQPYIIGEAKRISTLVSLLDKRDPILRPFFELGIELI